MSQHDRCENCVHCDIDEDIEHGGEYFICLRLDKDVSYDDTCEEWEQRPRL